LRTAHFARADQQAGAVGGQRLAGHGGEIDAAEQFQVGHVAHVDRGVTLLEAVGGADVGHAAAHENAPATCRQGDRIAHAEQVAGHGDGAQHAGAVHRVEGVAVECEVRQGGAAQDGQVQRLANVAGVEIDQRQRAAGGQVGHAIAHLDP